MKSQLVLAAAWSAALFVAPCRDVLAQSHEHDHAHADGHSHEDEFHLLPAGFEANLLEGWTEAWTHSDYSRKGTPFVHLFLNEPAYLDSGFLFDFAFIQSDEGVEYEAEAEFEFALSRRVGLVVEAPYIVLDPDEGESENGFGDLALVPRILLLDYDRFLLSANIEFEFPTGDEDKGLGAGEGIIAPALSTWIDLGNDFTLQGSFGIEHGLSSDFDTLTWGAAIAHSIYLKGTPEIIRSDRSVRSHYPVGMLSLIAELSGEHPLDGDEEGIGTASLVLEAAVDAGRNTPALRDHCSLAFRHRAQLAPASRSRRALFL
jgi:hypothetical protein